MSHLPHTALAQTPAPHRMLAYHTQSSGSGSSTTLNARLPHTESSVSTPAPPRMLACHTGLLLRLQHQTSQAEWGTTDPGIQKVQTGVSRIQHHPQLLHTDSDATLGLMRLCHKYKNIIKEHKSCRAVKIQS